MPDASALPFLIDSHCHPDFPELSERLPDLLDVMRENRVAGALCIGVHPGRFADVLALAGAHSRFFASVGLHPEYEEPDEPTTDDIIAWAARHAKIIAIGETGLDYHWHKDKPEWQRQRFRAHIRAAVATQKPLIIHMRDAAADTISILREEDAARAGGIFHCFSEDWAVAEAALSLGFYVSFSGIVTFRNAKSVQDVARKLPLDRLLVETDAPYLAPVPHRGKTNQPAYVRYVAEAVAALRNMPLAEIMTATSENFFRLFPMCRAAMTPWKYP
jgi:TatD DNase family protein